MDLAELLGFAAEKSSSDLIVTANSPPILRINGEMRLISAQALQPDEVKRLVYDVLDESQIARFESENELDFSLFLKGVQRFRGNAFVQRGAWGRCFG